MNNRKSIIVAVNPKLAIDNPKIKKTKSGKKYIEHRQVTRQSIHPNCYCHERTYLAPHDFYFTCEDCKEMHHFNCDLSPAEDLIESEFYNIEKCHHCMCKRFIWA